MLSRHEIELLARDANRNIGKELLQAIRDVKAGKHGAKYPNTRCHDVAPHAYSTIPDIRAYTCVRPTRAKRATLAELSP